MAWMEVDDGKLIIEAESHTYEIQTEDDWNEFYNMIEKGELEFPNGFSCSSSVDFPEEYGASKELIDVIRNGVGR